MSLEELLKDWREWATGTDCSEEGWATDFPDWSKLVEACKESMLDPSPSLETAEQVGECWKLDEESEELADFARSELHRTLDLIKLLTKHESPTVRWQAYDVLGDAANDVENDLRRGFLDQDPYVRRRAILAFARGSRPITHEIVRTALGDEEPHVRRLAWGLAQLTEDPDLIDQTRMVMASDEHELVRSAVDSWPERR